MCFKRSQWGEAASCNKLALSCLTDLNNPQVFTAPQIQDSQASLVKVYSNLALTIFKHAGSQARRVVRRRRYAQSAFFAAAALKMDKEGGANFTKCVHRLEEALSNCDLPVCAEEINDAAEQTKQLEKKAPIMKTGERNASDEESEDFDGFQFMHYWGEDCNLSPVRLLET